MEHEDEISAKEYYDELYERYKKGSACLDDEFLKKHKCLMFTFDYYELGENSIFRRKYDNLKHLCYTGLGYRRSLFFPTIRPIPFKFENGHVVGNIFDHMRFCSQIKYIKQFIENHINDDIEKCNWFDIENKVVAKISQEEIEKVEHLFKITRLF